MLESMNMKGGATRPFLFHRINQIKMKTQSKKHQWLLTAACICGLVNAAGAAESVDATELEEVVVTGNQNEQLHSPTHPRQ